MELPTYKAMELALSLQAWKVLWLNMHYGSASTFQTKAKYKALIASLNIVKELGVEKLKAFIDSWLIIGHVWGEYEARDPIIVKYL